MPIFAGQGDPARSMALLWRTPGPRTGPGPKPGLTVDAIGAAAIAVADTDGLAGLSMGMTADFEVAVEEGATLIRIGTALFGPRPTRGTGAAATGDAR